MTDHDDYHLHEEDEDILTLEKLKSWSKKSLQDWLIKHGFKKSGNKTILANRIFRALNFGESDLSDSTSSDEENSRDLGLPEIKELTNWADLTTSNCPVIRSEDVDNYFLYEKNPVTGKAKQCNRQLKKSLKFCNQNYVGEVQYHCIDNSSPYCVIRSKCKPSMRQKVAVAGGYLRTFYSLSVTMTKHTGKIINATCDCKAGLSAVCSHVGGLLLTLVNVKNSCTSTGCRWIGPVANITNPPSPKRLADIKFTYDSSKEVPVKPYPNVYQAGPYKDQDNFLKDILKGLQETCPQSVLYCTMCETSANIDDIFSMFQPNFMYTDSVDVSSPVCQTVFREFTNNLYITEDQINRVNNATRGQERNKNWILMRSNLVTASTFGMICRRRESTPPDNLIRLTRGYNQVPDYIPSLQHGRRYENTARRVYMKHHIDSCGPVVEMQDMGLVVSKDYPFMGASVDGLVTCSICGTGGLEIKCPYGKKGDKWRHKVPADCAENTSFCSQLSGGQLCLKETHQYYYQVMGQMAVLGLCWVDFVIWTKKGMAVQRIPFNEEFWQQKMLHRLKDFYSHDFVAELFTDRVKRGTNLYR